MATGTDSDVVPLRKGTKRRLVEIKRSATFDEAINALLDTAPVDAVKAQLRQPARRQLPADIIEAAWREPDKQLLIAELAEESWRAWRRSGRVKDLGPRAVSWRPEVPEEDVKIAWTGRRGLPA